MTDKHRWIVVSDTHLRRDPASDSRNPGSALVQFLRARAYVEGTHTTLILLGDIFELLDDVDPDPDRALDAILNAHQDVISELRQVCRRGASLAVVPGNHDAALATPEVWRRFSRALGSDAPADLYPWIVYVPGVLYAEHGHQHHDLNRMPSLLTTHVGRATPFQPPLAAPNRFAAGKAFYDSWRSERRSSRPDYDHLRREEATRLGLSSDVVRSLHDLSRFRPIRTAGRLAGVLAGSTACGNEAQALKQAARVADILETANAGVASIILGHTHRARRMPLTNSASYLNTGTWTSDVRGSGPDTVDRNLFPYVEITRERGAVDVEQQYFAVSGRAV